MECYCAILNGWEEECSLDEFVLRQRWIFTQITIFYRKRVWKYMFQEYNKFYGCGSDQIALLIMNSLSRKILLLTGSVLNKYVRGGNYICWSNTMEDSIIWTNSLNPKNCAAPIRKARTVEVTCFQKSAFIDVMVVWLARPSFNISRKLMRRRLLI